MIALALAAHPALADGCSTTTPPGTTLPEPGRLVAPLGAEVAPDGAILWEESLEAPDALELLVDGIPVDVVEDQPFPLFRLARQVRILHPVVPPTPGQELSVTAAGVEAGAFVVADGTAQPPPAFSWLGVSATPWDDPDDFGNATYHCWGPEPEQRLLTFDLAPPPDGVERYALVAELADESAEIAAPSWGEVVLDRYELVDLREEPAGPCFVGVWLGDAGTLGLPSEPICAPEEVEDKDSGCGCASDPSPAGALAGVGALLTVGRRRRR